MDDPHPSSPVFFLSRLSLFSSPLSRLLSRAWRFRRLSSASHLIQKGMGRVFVRWALSSFSPSSLRYPPFRALSLPPSWPFVYRQGPSTLEERRHFVTAGFFLFPSSHDESYGIRRLFFVCVIRVPADLKPHRTQSKNREERQEKGVGISIRDDEVQAVSESKHRVL